MDDHLLLRSIQGTATPDEERRVQAWLDTSEANRATYERMREAWMLLEHQPLVRSGRPRPTAESLIAASELRAAMKIPKSPARSRVRRYVLTGGLLAAASFAGLLFMRGPAIDMGIPTERIERSGTAGIEFTTGPRETVTVRLADGSIARLGSSSLLRIDHDNESGDRAVWLEGQAFFAVASDSTRRFVVRSSRGETSVLGTRFEVRADADNLRVVVVDGRVTVASGEESVVLNEREMAIAREGVALESTAVPDVYTLLDWMDRVLVFHETRVNRAIEEISYRYGVPVTVMRADVNDMLITGSFTDQSFEDVVHAICTALAIECEITPDGAVLGTRAPSLME